MPDAHTHDVLDPVGQLRIRLLGGFALSVGGTELAADHWPSLRAAQLVQLLSLAPRYRLTRERVIDSLWPQLGPDAGAANLRKAVHHARQALGRHEGLLSHGGDVMLWPHGRVDVDVDNFEQLAKAALTAPHGQKREACAQALDAYGGELLPGSAYEAWAEPARERLHAHYIELLRFSEQWERLAEADPTDEPAHRELMALELAAGNRAAAIRWYARLREALQQELAITPNDETEALYEACVAGLQPEGPAFVGRAMLQAQALAWLGMAPADRPGGIALRGPTGIGKTAFCRELGALARERGWTVVRVDAAQPGRTYAVIAALAETVVMADRSVLDRIGAPARSVLAQLSSLAAPAAELPGPLGRHQVIGALRRLLLAASDGAEMLVLVDDAHLADDADVDVLMHLIASGPPVCVVLAMRPPALGSALGRSVSRLVGSGAMQTLDLEPLGNEETRRLVIQAAPNPWPDQVVSHIVRASQGNPFAAIELARCAKLSGKQALPHNVADAILARLCDVNDAALASLKWLALAGDVFDATTAAALAPDAEASAFAALDIALTAGVLRLDGARYRFRHELVRQTLIEQIPPHQRLKMHRQAAHRLADLNAAPAVVARHWLAGDSLREAMPWLLSAARDAVRLAAFSDALRHLEPVLAFDGAHAEALQLRARAMDAMGDPAAVLAYRAAADAAGEPMSHNLRAQAALAQIKQGDPEGALRALVGVRPNSVEGRLCEALTYSGAAAMGAADPAMGSQKAAEARRLALQTGDTSALVTASWAQAAAAHARGELDQSVWADLQDTSQLPHLAIRVFDGQLCILQRFLYGARPYPEVIAFANGLAAEALRLGAARGHAFGITIRGEAELLSGDLQAAEKHLGQGVLMHRAIGAVTGEAFATQRMAEVAMHRGRHDDARALIGHALDLARQSDVGFHLLDRIYGTRILLARNRTEALHFLEDAREAVHGPLETCPGCRITFTVPAAIAAARAGRLDLAEEYAAQTAYLANVVMRLPAWHAAHDEVLAHMAIVRCEGVEVAVSRFAKAAKRFQDAGHPIDAARCERSAADAASGAADVSDTA
ncbi:MAG: AAA family ATPase [Simplicispira suum]|uniref:AAA family ATPase n=1 Tax=Simplicispira suum TaxID=2109915 RepID=UPI001C6CCF12|nr:AAA family ATPase [Simplicispira suum]MBW7833915.1 AAA family ATPase [Simplicispira suum]